MKAQFTLLLSAILFAATTTLAQAGEPRATRAVFMTYTELVDICTQAGLRGAEYRACTGLSPLQSGLTAQNIRVCQRQTADLDRGLFVGKVHFESCIKNMARDPGLTEAQLKTCVSLASQGRTLWNEMFSKDTLIAMNHCLAMESVRRGRSAERAQN